MDLVEKYQSALVLAAIAVGLAVGQIDGVASVADRLILPFLMVMLFAAFVGIPLSHLREAFGNRRVVGSSLLVNFVWSPLLAVGLRAVFLRDQPALWVGLIMLLVTPCTDWYLVFTDIADGDVPLATSVLPYNLVLQLVLLPVYLYAFAGTLVDLPLALLVESVLLVLVVPLIFGGIARWGLTQTKGETWFRERFLPRLSPIQIVFLALAIGAMFASQGEVVVENPACWRCLRFPSCCSTRSTSRSGSPPAACFPSRTARWSVSTTPSSRGTPHRARDRRRRVPQRAADPAGARDRATARTPAFRRYRAGPSRGQGALDDPLRRLVERPIARAGAHVFSVALDSRHRR